MNIYIGDILPILIVIQCLLFSTILITDNGPKKISNRILAAFLLGLSLQFTALLLQDYNIGFSFIEKSLCIYGFLYGPLLYLYTRSLIYNSFKLSINHCLHFLPFLILFMSIFSSLDICGYLSFLFYFSLIIYSFFAIKEIITYRKILRETKSSVGRINLNWLEIIMILFCIILSLDIVDIFIQSLDIISGISTIHLGLLILINIMFYKGFKQPEIFLGISNSDKQMVLDKKNDYLVYSEEDKLDVERIKEYIALHEVYINSELSLDDLSNYLEMPSRRLSFLINNFMNQNFMGFINSHRIEKAINRLSNPEDENETISEIMYDVGFNSKSSFNTLFKKKTGLTPTEYKRKHS